MSANSRSIVASFISSDALHARDGIPRRDLRSRHILTPRKKVTWKDTTLFAIPAEFVHATIAIPVAYCDRISVPRKNSPEEISTENRDPA